MYTTALLLVFIALVSADPSRHEIFDTFLKKYGKTYTGAEYEERRAIFMSNYQYILENSGKNGVHLAVNQHTDLANHEMPKVRSSPRPTVSSEMEKRAGGLPDFLDWRKKGAVGPVHNQGQMGAYVLTF